jgi:hypothetical protein
MLDFQPRLEGNQNMSLAIRIIFGSLAAAFLYVVWLVVSITRYQIKRGPHVATGLGVLRAIAINTALQPLFLMALVAVVLLAIKA